MNARIRSILFGIGALALASVLSGCILVDGHRGHWGHGGHGGHGGHWGHGGHGGHHR